MTGTARAGRYAAVAIVLHWLIALLIVLQVSLAWRMGGKPTPESFAVFQLHKSVGITVLFLSLIRLGWRLINPPPPEPPGLQRWDQGAVARGALGLLRDHDRHAPDRLADSLGEPH